MTWSIRFRARPFFLSGLLAASLAGCATTSHPVAPSTSTALRSPPRSLIPGAVRTIVVDAGHGGHDPGTSHFGLKEKYLALDIAKRLRTHLQKRGITVVMTRDSDRFIPLSGRPAVANKLNADLFVSVHINANRKRSVSGIEVYYPRASVVSNAAAWPPVVGAAEVDAPGATVKQVLWDMVLKRTRSQSRRLASSLCRSMRTGMATNCRGIKPAKFVVLREAWMPSVLVEVGYVSNQAEAQKLGTAGYRETAAQSICEGIMAYVRDQVGAEHI